MSASTTIKSTGEMIIMEDSTQEQVVESLALVNESIKAWELVKAKLQKRARDIVNPDGTYIHGGYCLRVSQIQRMNYDKGTLRQVFDEDVLELFMEPAKGRIDKYIAENRDNIGDAVYQLHKTMVATGDPYTTCKLERLK